MRRLLILILAVALAYVLIVRESRKSDALEAAARPPSEAMPNREATPSPNRTSLPAVATSGARVTRLQCVIVRGVVVGSDEGGLHIDCEDPAPASAEAVSGDPAKTFGELSLVRDGRLIPAPWTPAQKATGVVTLEGHPPARLGETVNVVAAMKSGELYAAVFALAPDNPGDWKRMIRPSQPAPLAK